MEVYAFAGADAVVTLQPLQWSRVEVAFSGGVVESAVAEHGLAAHVQAGASVAVGGSGGSYPGGLALTATFAAATVMADVRIDFASPATAIAVGDATVSWAGQISPRFRMSICSSWIASVLPPTMTVPTSITPATVS